LSLSKPQNTRLVPLGLALAPSLLNFSPSLGKPQNALLPSQFASLGRALTASRITAPVMHSPPGTFGS
jgi:hypothetical protein